MDSVVHRYEVRGTEEDPVLCLRVAWVLGVSKARTGPAYDALGLRAMRGHPVVAERLTEATKGDECSGAAYDMACLELDESIRGAGACGVVLVKRATAPRSEWSLSPGNHDVMIVLKAAEVLREVFAAGASATLDGAWSWHVLAVYGGEERPAATLVGQLHNALLVEMIGPTLDRLVGATTQQVYNDPAAMIYRASALHNGRVG